jgi:hypothetical protein
MSNGTLLWTAAVFLASLIAVAIALEYDVIVAFFVWLFLALILMWLLPE